MTLVRQNGDHEDGKCGEHEHKRPARALSGWFSKRMTSLEALAGGVVQ